MLTLAWACEFAGKHAHGGRGHGTQRRCPYSSCKIHKELEHFREGITKTRKGESMKEHKSIHQQPAKSDFVMDLSLASSCFRPFGLS
jgi:hypothetical protein